MVDLSVNPLRQGLGSERTPEPNVMVIFGATGDLTHRKLVPALYDLALDGLLPVGFSVVGFARRKKTDEECRLEMQEAVDKFARKRPAQGQVWEGFAQGLYYLQSEFGDPHGYEKLSQFLDRIDMDRGTGGNRLFYLATPPNHYAQIIKHLGASGLARRSQQGWRRIIIEKPFGQDLQTARELNRHALSAFDEDQVYRIDHYLGKETVQNILVFRFANGIFEPIWNRRYIDHVQIAVAESVGVENRAAYFEGAGTIRDMVQNHILQLLSLVAMEPPASFDADSVRDEKVKVLRSIPPIHPGEVGAYTVRGQYGPGWAAGEEVKGYREESGVAPDSAVETFLALKLVIDNWRWAGVPFYLRSGKRLPKRVTEIAIQFKRAPLLLFGKDAAEGAGPNVLVLRIQPDEGISLKFGSKVPGPTVRIRSVNMDFRYGASFGLEPPDAYERLLLDAMVGDSTLFIRRDETEAAWSLVDGIVDGWRESPRPSFPNYEAGSWGPEEAHKFMEKDGRRWRRL